MPNPCLVHDLAKYETLSRLGALSAKDGDSKGYIEVQGRLRELKRHLWHVHPYYMYPANRRRS